MTDREPAFPQLKYANTKCWEGITIRDYFAAKAMQGLIASNIHNNFKDDAEWAYHFADAMLKERAQ